MKSLTRVVFAFLLSGIGILAMLMIVPKQSGKRILIGHVSGSQLIYADIFIMLLLCIIFVILRYRQNKCGQNLALMIVGIVFSTVALSGTLFFYFLFMADSETYYTFYSPDGKYSVVAREWSWLLAGQVTLYERTSPFLIEEKATMITDDGFRPISSDAYELQWNGNVVAFTIETMDWERKKETAVVELTTRK